MTDLMKAEGVILPLLLENNDETEKSLKEIRCRLRGSFNASGLSKFKSWFLWWMMEARLKHYARKGCSLKEIEEKIKPFFKKRIDQEEVYIPAVTSRAEKISDELNPYIIGDSVLDLGAGNGLIGEMLSKRHNKDVTLIDVIDYSLCDLPMLLFQEGDTIPLDDNSIDTCVIYLVLHHSDQPEKLLQEATRVARKRVILMEGYVDDDETFVVNGLLDWFLNRVVQGVDINLPLNYRKIDDWKNIFKSLNLTCVKTDVVGIDEPIAPESHVLFILDKESGNEY